MNRCAFVVKDERRVDVDVECLAVFPHHLLFKVLHPAPFKKHANEDFLQYRLLVRDEEAFELLADDFFLCKAEHARAGCIAAGDGMIARDAEIDIRRILKQIKIQLL